jgi:transcriptional regulator of arginine metabolism
MTADRRKRQLKILELVATHPIHTQDELAERLAAEGWEVTQPTLSRDIQQLRLHKADGVYRRPAAGEQFAPDSDERRIAEGLLGADPAGEALVIVHTPPGEANRVGAALDRLAWAGMVGTLAGDDTIFVAVRDRAAQRRVLAALTRLVAGK